jgi:hypothetical protein
VAKPIRKSLLVHEIGYQEYDGNDRLGETYKPSINVSLVRVEPKRSVVVNTNNESIVSNTLLFIDAYHTAPRIVPKEKSKVVFEGVSYIVQKVNTFYAGSNRVHHWEAILV